jgi:2-phosphosulfolactate phosphatase
MEIAIEPGLEGATRARGVAVVIDVFRAFTVSAYALAAGAAECILVRTVEEARSIAAGIPGARVSAEVDGLPVPGIALSNSPTMVAGLDWEGRTLVQRTSAGTQGATAAALHAERVLACSLVVADATVRRLRELGPRLVTLVPTGGEGTHVEDAVCTELLRARLEGAAVGVPELLDRIRRDGRYAALAGGQVPGFPPTDLELALQLDRFDFAQEVVRADGRLRLRAVAPSTP